MNEHGYIDAIHRQLQKMNRENGHPVMDMWKVFDPYRGGKADARYDFRNKDLRLLSQSNKSAMWIEYKYVTLPKREGTAIDLCKRKDGLSPLQQIWLRERYLSNISIAVIVGAKEGSVILTDLQWETPLYRSDFEQGATIKEVATWIQNGAVPGN